MTIPIDAIDPEAGYRQWVEQYLWHVDQLPNVVQAVGTIAMAPQSLRAAQLRERVSGGGFIDNMPVVDGPEFRNAAAVWHALRAYLNTAASRLGVEAPAIPVMLPDEPDVARQWAFVANEWMAAWVEHILSWPDLAEREGELFRLIRRARTRLDTGTVRRARPAVCELCGEAGVTVDWEEGPDGPALIRACQVCHHRPGADA
ncbi:hypothetical protein QE430_002497 [Microbacterium testaceum]|uniref:hypothetical protein n=1 Tax=Microbacterium testaceum TaxID=2033 RepID=UPI002780C50B|nr:hypothetical protein [Microbacterium testaceum]MDQ1174190.1 hypothetical protein [Microbacterium testaceum]